MSKVAAVRLEPQEEEEMNNLGFKNPSVYIRWKLGKLTPEDLALLPDPSLVTREPQNVVQTSLFQPEVKKEVATANVQDAVRIAQQDAEIRRLQGLLEQKNDSEKQTLGSVPAQIEAEVNKRLKEKEHEQLLIDKTKLESENKKLEEDKRKVEDELRDAKVKLKMWDQAKEILPVAQPLLGAIASGILKTKGGGGLAGFLEGFASGAGPGVGSTPQLSQEDLEALSLGQNIRSMFTPEELHNVLVIVANLGQRKDLIAIVPALLQKFIAARTQKQQAAKAATNVNPSDIGSDSNLSVSHNADEDIQDDEEDLNGHDDDDEDTGGSEYRDGDIPGLTY